DHEQRVRQPRHLLDPVERLLVLRDRAVEPRQILLRQLLDLLLVTDGAELLLEALDRLPHGAEVREHAAEPAVVDVELARALRFALHDLLGLPLGRDEQDLAAGRNRLAQEVEARVQPAHGLIEVDDVDAAALAEDERLHLRVPAPRLVAEGGAGFEQRPPRGRRAPAGRPRGAACARGRRRARNGLRPQWRDRCPRTSVLLRGWASAPSRVLPYPAVGRDGGGGPKRVKWRWGWQVWGGGFTRGGGGA